MGEKNASASRDKVELDAFNVLNTEAARVEKVEVTSASGMTTVSKAGSTLQMKAAVTPAGGDQMKVLRGLLQQNQAARQLRSMKTVFCQQEQQTVL